MEINQFTDLFYESLKLFKHFGSAVKLGFQEINQNADMMLKNRDNLKAHLNLPDDAPEIKYMEQFMYWEMKHGIEMCNSSNNKSLLKKWDNKDDIKPWMYSHKSMCWQAQRGAWFFEFMGEIMRILNEERNLSLSKVAIKSYNNKLARHHPWILQKILNVAFNATTSRENFLKTYAKEKQETMPRDTPYTDEDVY